MAAEYAKEKILVNCVCPGGTMTPMLGNMKGKNMAEFTSLFPIQRLGDPKEIASVIARKVRTRRKEAKLTQEGLSKKSGVSLGSLKRFENTGEISLCSLLKIAIALGYEEDFEQLFVVKQYRSIQEIIDGQY